MRAAVEIHRAMHRGSTRPTAAHPDPNDGQWELQQPLFIGRSAVALLLADLALDLSRLPEVGAAAPLL